MSLVEFAEIINSELKSEEFIWIMLPGGLVYGTAVHYLREMADLIKYVRETEISR
jgi:hypothetical protein